MLIKEKNKKTKNNLFPVLVYFALGILVYGVSNTSIFYYGLMPFGVSVIFALLAIGYNGYYLSIVYIRIIFYNKWQFFKGKRKKTMNVIDILTNILYNKHSKK